MPARSLCLGTAQTFQTQTQECYIKPISLPKSAFPPGICFSPSGMCVPSCSVMSDSVQLHRLQPTRLLSPWSFSGKNIGVGCYFIFQGIFLTQELNLRLLHWQADSLPLCYLGRDYHLRQRAKTVSWPFLPPIAYRPRPAKCCTEYITLSKCLLNLSLFHPTAKSLFNTIVSLLNHFESESEVA